MGGHARATTFPWDSYVGAAVASLTFLAFLSALGNGWVNWDDADNFLANPHYRGLAWANLRWILTGSVQDAHWVPLTWLTLSLDYVLWGMRPAGYHLTAVILHSISAFLCYRLADRLLELGLPSSSRASERRVGAAVAALFWALHPLRVESVAWITERRDVLMGLFAFATLLAWLRACSRGRDARPPRGWYWVAVGCFALALSSKTMVVGLPFVLVVLDVYPLRRIDLAQAGATARLARSVLAEKAPFWLLALAASAVTLVIAGERAHTTPLAVLGVGQRLAVAAYGLAFSLGKTVVPAGLSPLYTLFHPVEPWSMTYVGPAIVVVAITVLTVLARRRWPAGLAAWISYAALLLPMLGLIHSGAQITADRFTYLAAVGPAVLLGATVTWCLAASRAHRIAHWLGPGMAVATMIWLLALAALTMAQIGIWKDSVSLWRRAAEVEPASDIPIFYLGWALEEAGRFDEARAHFEWSLAHVPPELPALRAQFLFHIALVEQRAGRMAAAEARLREALQLDPEHPAALIRLGTALWTREARDEARQAWTRAAALASHWSRYQLWEIRSALEAMPDVPLRERGMLAFHLGTWLEQHGQRGQALELYRRAATLPPGDRTACERASRLDPRAEGGAGAPQ